MHILALLTAVLGAIGVILWRLHMAADAAKGLAETASDAHGLFRRLGWQRKLAKDALDLVSDPREAAAAMMVALAQSDGAMTERERRTILVQIVQRLGASGRQAEELLAHGRWLTRDVKDTNRCFQKLVPFLQRTCDRGQIQDVLDMLNDVSLAEGTPGVLEVDALMRLRQALKPGR
jgi:uncharacterized tellurite resistance protein B-like protein